MSTKLESIESGISVGLRTWEVAKDRKNQATNGRTDRRKGREREQEEATVGWVGWVPCDGGGIWWYGDSKVLFLAFLFGLCFFCGCEVGTRIECPFYLFFVVCCWCWCVLHLAIARTPLTTDGQGSFCSSFFALTCLAVHGPAWFWVLSKKITLVVVPQYIFSLI